MDNSFVQYAAMNSENQTANRGEALDAAIAGGGLAGIATALLLAEAGLKVLLLEKKPLLGGRASSYLDARTGERVDECQHGTLRCCTYLADLLQRLGIERQIRYFDAMQFVDARGVHSEIRGSFLPPPFHTAPSFLRFRALGLADKASIGRAMVQLMRARPAEWQDRESVANWFVRTRQTERSVSCFWRPVLVSACNEEPEAISCTHAFKVFRDAFLATRTGFHFGVPAMPLASLWHEPSLHALRQHGAEVRNRATISALEVENGQICGIRMKNGELVRAAHYVSALQQDLLLRLLPAETTTDTAFWERAGGIDTVPILGVHLWFDKPIQCPPALALLERRMEWVFNRGALYGKPEDEPAFLSLVVSASRSYADKSREEIVQIALEDVQAALPEAKNAKLVRHAVVHWPRATISPCPGVDALRPGPQTPLDNLVLAGEWTRTGWPSTMEGAVRSGHAAARFLLKKLGMPAPRAVSELQRGMLAKLLLGRETDSPGE